VGFDKVVDLISNHGLRLIRPFLRGFGPTEVNEPGARSGEAAALGQDLLDLADALGISVLKVVGHDWGSRAGHAAAILAPHRISSLLAIASPYLDDLLSQGLIYCDPSRELSFWRPTQSALLALGLRSHTDIPALKELEEWFDTQKEMRGIAKLDPYFERTSRLASRRLKREIERRGTLREFALEPDPSLKRIPTEESGSDLFRE
jgi:pimeloyl-ACP methyl ester carboxylesterase